MALGRELFSVVPGAAHLTRGRRGRGGNGGHCTPIQRDTTSSGKNGDPVVRAKAPLCPWGNNHMTLISCGLKGACPFACVRGRWWTLAPEQHCRANPPRLTALGPLKCAVDRVYCALWRYRSVCVRACVCMCVSVRGLFYYRGEPIM